MSREKTKMKISFGFSFVDRKVRRFQELITKPKPKLVLVLVFANRKDREHPLVRWEKYDVMSSRGLTTSSQLQHTHNHPKWPTLGKHLPTALRDYRTP